jgi:hypothetical protein
MSTALPFAHHPPFGLSLSKPRVTGPFDRLRVNGVGRSAFTHHPPFGLSLSKPPRHAA